MELEEKTGSDTYIFTTWNNAEIKAHCLPQRVKPLMIDLFFDPSHILFFDTQAEDQPLISCP